MFAVLYRWRIKFGMEKIFQDSWRILTQEFISDHGALGSCLHQTEDGLWAAYARWPSREAWKKEKKICNQIVHENLKNTIEERFDPICMEIVEDHLQHLGKK